MTDYQNKTDAGLVGETLRDGENFLYLMQRYEEKLARYIRRFAVLNMECAEDVLQEVFLKAYRNLNDFDQNLSFSSWIYRIAHNESVNYLKKHRGKETISLETNDNEMLNLIDVLESDVDIAAEAARNELKVKVREVLGEMSEKYRDVLVLKYLEEKDYTEISDILKKPMGTVATLINRAKEQFRQISEKHHIKSLMH